MAHYYQRFAEHKLLFGLPTEQSLLVVPKANKTKAITVKKRTGMTMINSVEIENQLQQIFNLE